MHFLLVLFSIFNFLSSLAFFFLEFVFPSLVSIFSHCLLFGFFVPLIFCSFFYFLNLLMFFCFFCLFFCSWKIFPADGGAPRPASHPRPTPRATPLLPALPRRDRALAGEAAAGFIRGWSGGWLCWSGGSLCSPSGYSCELGGSCYPCRSCRWRWAWWRPSGGPC